MSANIFAPVGIGNLTINSLQVSFDLFTGELPVSLYMNCSFFSTVIDIFFA